MRALHRAVSRVRQAERRVARVQLGKCARLIGTMAGKRVYVFPVEVKHNNSRACATVATYTRDVISHSAADAADAIRDEVATIPETEITVFGPKGGRAAYRFIGWESAVWRAMCQSRGHLSQARLSFDEVAS